MLWVLRYFIGVALTSVQIQATSDSTAALWLGNTHNSFIYNAMQALHNFAYLLHTLLRCLRFKSSPANAF
jgi:hypothetical protein